MGGRGGCIAVGRALEGIGLFVVSAIEPVATFVFVEDMQLSIPSVLVMSIPERPAQFGAGVTQSVIRVAYIAEHYICHGLVCKTVLSA